MSKGPGSKPLIVTLCLTVLRARPAINPVNPARAPFDRPKISMGDLTDAEVILTIRPNLRSIMPSTVALIRNIGVSMLASTAAIQSSRFQSRKSPGGGPPALFTRMSGFGQAANTLAWPSAVVISQATVVTVAPESLRMSSAVASRSAVVRELMINSTPSRPNDIALARPKPFDAAQTMAFRSEIPRSIMAPLRSVVLFVGV